MLIQKINIILNTKKIIIIKIIISYFNAKNKENTFFLKVYILNNLQEKLKNYFISLNGISYHLHYIYNYSNLFVQQGL